MNSTPRYLNVRTPSHHYPIMFKHNVLHQAYEHIKEHIKGHKVFIVTDNNVASYYLDAVSQSFASVQLDVHHFVVPAGEESKSFSSYERVINDMLSKQPDRKTTLIALGGGVVGDLTGFLAATLLRGVAFIQIPTSLLAQVDSSVGGKTAINCIAGKNLVGAFYQPQAVLIDMATLRHLPDRDMRSGYAEVLKYGLLGDAVFYRYLLEHAQDIMTKDANVLTYIIHHCCKMKADIVAQDEKERGKRALLNLGHTFAHAIEKHAAYDGTVLHGEAVALGCLMAAKLAVYEKKISEDAYHILQSHCHSVGLPTHLSRDIAMHQWDAVQLTHYCYHDKKSEKGGLTFITLNEIGDAHVTKDMNPKLIERVFSEFIS